MMKEKKVDETIAKCRSKRIMTPAVDGMTVKQERSCLSEIRTNAADIKADHVLSNGWTAGNFALCYLMGQNRKRKDKNHFKKNE